MLKISIVTPVLNRQDTIRDTLQSVRLQSYPNVEHIIQDGGSNDNTLSIIKEFGSTTYHLVSERDSGLYDGVNRGIRRATGDIIGILNSDDKFAHSDVLTKIALQFQNQDIDGVYGHLDYVRENRPDQIVRRWRSEDYRYEAFRSGWMPPHPTLYLRRHVYETLGLYDTQFRIAADYDAMLRYCWIGRIRLAFIPDVFVKMRLGGASNRNLSLIVRKSYEDYRAIRKNNAGGLGTLFLKNIRKLPQFFGS